MPRNMGLGLLRIVRWWLGYASLLLRRMGLRGFFLTQKADSILRFILYRAYRVGVPSQEREIVAGDPVCCSMLPQASSCIPTASASEELRETTLVASLGKSRSSPENANWFGDEKKPIIYSPKNTLDAPTEEDFMVKDDCSKEIEDVLELSQVIEDLYPVSVAESERYERGVTIPRGNDDDFCIPVHMEPCAEPIPPPWIRFVHPEGAVYFWDPDRRVVTDVDMLNDDTRGLVENQLAMIQNYVERYNITSARLKHVHLYLEYYPKTSSFGYYFVDHTKQTLFWLDKKSGHLIIGGLQTPSPSLTHVGIELRSQYWHHNEYFPHLLHVSNETLSELQDILWHAVGDLLTSSTSTCPFTVAETKDMQGLVAEVIAHHRESSNDYGYTQNGKTMSGGIDVGARTMICRFLRMLLHQRFLNFHGEIHARLNRDQSVFEKTKRTWFMGLVSPLLLYAPETYLQNIQSLAVDGLVDKPSWDKLISGLTGEWKENTLFATVLLTSNVSFLAIQSLDDLGSVGYRNPAQRVSYLSIALSIGTIVLGLSLNRQYHTTLKRNFFANRSVTALGFETLAIMHSLPHALLMSAMVTFFLAFSIMCYQSRDNVSIAILTSAWIIIVVLFLWCISTPYESTVYEALSWPRRKLNELREIMGDRLRGRNAITEHISDEVSV